MGAEPVKGYCRLCGNRVLYITIRQPRRIGTGNWDDGNEIVNLKPEVTGKRLAYVPNDERPPYYKVSSQVRKPRYTPHRCRVRSK